MAIINDILQGFLTTVKGMIVTGKECFVPAVTVQYPTEKRPIPERFRGMLVNDASICIACDKCVRICPVNCLYCEGEGKGKARRASVFTIDYVKCCWCALCVEVCPVDSLYMSHDYETVFTDRSQMIRDFCQDPIPPIGGRQKPAEESSDNPAEKKEGESNSGRAAA
ncbi:MAG: NADH-quinone oxidoreductase subunit I [Candidatus Omnitrophota bacterium]|jgi:NADH-quinone oxidoreductase subunit I|nr:MAG: NADH-quinone oxidoreductase subunit I [Candidatus Omnitrophota bacterium]